MSKYENEKEQNLDKYKNEYTKKDVGYNLFLFVIFFLLWKESNYLIYIAKEIESMNCFIYKPKIGLLYNYLLYIKVLR